MTDLELTKACADAMGWESKESRPDSKGRTYIVRRTPMDHMQDVWTVFDPLREDAQAMALVKRFKPPMVWGCHSVNGDTWYVGDGETNAEHADLNRAVMEYVAKENMRSTPQDGPT